MLKNKKQDFSIIQIGNTVTEWVIHEEIRNSRQFFASDAIFFGLGVTRPPYRKAKSRLYIQNVEKIQVTRSHLMLKNMFENKKSAHIYRMTTD